jgi:hypothetical protein
MFEISCWSFCNYPGGDFSLLLRFKPISRELAKKEYLLIGRGIAKKLTAYFQHLQI